MITIYIYDIDTRLCI